MDMTEIRKADPVARRRALLLVIVGALVGTLLLVAFERYYSDTLREWIASEPGELAHRVKLVFRVMATAMSVPLMALAVYLWVFGAKVLRTGQFPPPGYRVIRDTPVREGRSAAVRGRGFKTLALVLGVMSVALWLLMSRLASLLSRAAS
jgi:hypothetical protein